MGILPQDEAEKYLNLLKKALSGKLGKNLIDIIFSTEQVADSDEHRLLMALRDSELKDGEIREEFYLQIYCSAGTTVGFSRILAFVNKSKS